MKTSSLLKHCLFSLILITGASAHANVISPPTSSYIDLGTCHTVETGDEEGYFRDECAGFDNIEIGREGGDNRAWITFKLPGMNERQAIAQMGAGRSDFPYPSGDKVEIRYYTKGGKKIVMGAIYRISGNDVSDEIHPDTLYQTLVVVSFAQGKVTEIADIDVTNTPNANEAARRALDATLGGY